MENNRPGNPTGGGGSDESPFSGRIEPPEAATAEEVELDAELALDIADAATEEALLP
jgi:hypothetical protein